MRASFTNVYFAKFSAFYFGCLICFFLQSELKWSAITSSSVLGFLITLIPFPPRFDRKGIQVAFFTGTFAGMSSPEILSNYQHVLMISILTFIVFAVAKPFFVGLGGKMGAVAFLSTCFWLIIKAFV